MVDECWLYLIEILHQTTTTALAQTRSIWLYLIEILHQTTTSPVYIRSKSLLYLIEILHQTTTRGGQGPFGQRCILLKFYIKPQLGDWYMYIERVVSY